MSLDSECAASIETAGVNVGICTVFQRQNSAQAKTGLRRMTGGKICDRQILAANKFDHVGIAWFSGDRCFFQSRAAQGETIDVLNDQLRSLPIAVIDTIPGVPGAVGICAVI